MGAVTAENFRFGKFTIIGFQIIHEPFDPFWHGSSDSDTQDMWYRTQQAGGAPAANHHISLIGQFKDLFGREYGDAFLVGCYTLDEPRLAFTQTVDQTAGHVHFACHVLHY